jgi:hypothetical protein
VTWRAAVAAVGSACLKKGGLAFVALIASIVGAATLTGMLLYAMIVLEGARQWVAITNIAYGLLATVAMVLASLGLVISQRSLEAEFWKVRFKASGGDQTTGSEP